MFKKIIRKTLIFSLVICGGAIAYPHSLHAAPPNVFRIVHIASGRCATVDWRRMAYGVMTYACRDNDEAQMFVQDRYGHLQSLHTGMCLTSRMDYNTGTPRGTLTLQECGQSSGQRWIIDSVRRRILVRNNTLMTLDATDAEGNIPGAPGSWLKTWGAPFMHSPNLGFRAEYF